MSQQIQVDRQQALNKLLEAQRLNTDRNTLNVRNDDTLLRLAAVLSEIGDSRYAEECYAMPFSQYVEEKFRDERGLPRTYAWARNLVTRYRKIAEHQALVEMLETPPRAGQPYPSLNSSYLTARLAEVEEWQQECEKQARQDFPGEEPEDFVHRANRETQLFAEKLKEHALLPCSELRDRIAVAVANQKGGGKSEVDDWPFVGGRLDPNVYSAGKALVERICLLQDDGPNPDTLSFVQHYERVVGFADDCLEAFEAVVSQGNNDPLKALLALFEGDDD